MFTVVTVNVNGVRAAARRGGLAWLATAGADVICLQEVRASDAQLIAALADEGLGQLQVAHTASAIAGRAGVAVLSQSAQRSVRAGVGSGEFADTGRWIEAEVDSPFGPITVVSVYVHTGEADTPRQDEKHSFLDAMSARMKTLRTTAARRGGHVLICGDLNVAHRDIDIKNWRGNIGKAGFLESERAFLDRWFGRSGWVDLGRTHGGEGPGPYTWWSWRGQAFDTDTGWRIDYQVASPGLAARAQSVTVVRAASYAERMSDHAPLVVRFG